MLTATSYAAYIKRAFPKGFADSSYTNLIDQMWKDTPKATDAAGDLLVYLEDADDSFTASADYGTVTATNAATTDNIGSQFQFAWADFSDEAQLTTSVINKTKNNDSAWQSATKTAIKKKLNGLNHLAAVLMVGQGWGELGQITTVVNNTFKMLVPSQINRVAIKMPLLFAADLNVSACRSATPIYVTGVDPDSNLVTCSANLSVPGGVNNDFAFIGGMRVTGAPGGVRLTFPGLNAHLPDRTAAITDTTVSTLGNVVRSNNARLYGTFVGAQGGGSPLAALVQAVQKAATNGGATDITFYCSQAVYATVALDLANPVNYEGNPGKKTVGTSQVVFYSNGTTTGTLKVSKMMDDTVIYGLEKGAYDFISFGGFPIVDNLDGSDLGRLANTQGYGVRFWGSGGLRIKNHPACVRIQLV